jgi:putative endonuclease
MFSWLRNFFRAGSPPNTGERGEQMAAAWLTRERGFEVIARNWRSPRDRRDEIDLVCRDAGVLVFIEVKARAAGALVSGFHTIDARKKRVLRRAIKAYLALLREKPRTFRFDVVEVRMGISNPEPLVVTNAIASSSRRELRAPPPFESEVLHFENVPLFSKDFRA